MKGRKTTESSTSEHTAFALTTPGIRMAPSVLSADFSRLAEEIAAVEAAGAEMLHLDVMDGHFVPNISFGVPVIASLRKRTKLFLDAHLMISEPKRYAEAFVEAGCDHITFHIEALSGQPTPGHEPLPEESGPAESHPEPRALTPPGPRPEPRASARADSHPEPRASARADSHPEPHPVPSSPQQPAEQPGTELGATSARADSHPEPRASARADSPDAQSVVEHIHSLGVSVGVALNPTTPVGAIESILDHVDMVLVMSVWPGFGGQRFISDVLPKVKELRERLAGRQRLQIDGGIDEETIVLAAEAGADTFVAGSAVFGTSDPPAAMKLLRRLAQETNRQGGGG